MTERDRPPLRLRGYDYAAAGYYFVTVCTKGKRMLFASVGAGHLAGPTVTLTEYGRIVDEQIRAIPGAYPGVTVDKYVVMPNHVHLLIGIGTGPAGCPAPTNLPKIIGALKSLTCRKAGAALWQRSYYDHIIRDETDYLRIWAYIDANPARWAEDEYYIARETGSMATAGGVPGRCGVPEERRGGQ